MSCQHLSLFFAVCLRVKSFYWSAINSHPLWATQEILTVNNVFMHRHEHLLLTLLIPVQGAETYSVWFWGKRLEYTVDGSQVHHMAHTSITHTINRRWRESPITLMGMLLGWDQSAKSKNMQTPHRKDLAVNQRQKPPAGRQQYKTMYVVGS